MLPRNHPEYLMTTASLSPHRLARRRAARKAAANARTLKDIRHALQKEKT